MTCCYQGEDKEVMLFSHQAKHKSRFQELVSFAKLSGFKKLGVANCKGVQKYADRLVFLLKEQGFDVIAVNCKDSGFNGCTITEAMKGPCCDPLSQAEILNRAGTDFNINVGLCLGHGLLFQKYSRAAVTTFLVKDFATGHKTVECLS